jgi:hypothetical protein
MFEANGRRRLFMGTMVLLALALAVTVPAAAQYGAPENTLPDTFLESHQVGARLGGWSNQGDTPPDQFGPPSGEYYVTDFQSGNFYLEGFYGHRLNSSLMLEFSVGIVSRGDVILYEFPDTMSSSIGTMMIYPILIKMKWYPFGALSGKFFPYLVAGGGLYHGRHDIQIATGYDAYLRAEFGEDSQTKFDYVLGGGMDWPLASVVALDLQANYMPVSFSSDLVGIRDYSGLTITVGVKYLFTSNDEKKRNNSAPSRRSR